MAGKGLVLVTGANGYIAARTIEAFLQAGYSVRGTARSAATTKGLRDALAPYADRLEIVEVPDIAAAGAFDEAVKGNNPPLPVLANRSHASLSIASSFQGVGHNRH